jgi:hypothetical protein
MKFVFSPNKMKIVFITLAVVVAMVSADNFPACTSEFPNQVACNAVGNIFLLLKYIQALRIWCNFPLHKIQ